MVHPDFKSSFRSQIRRQNPLNFRQKAGSQSGSDGSDCICNDDEHENNQLEKASMMKPKYIFLTLSLVELTIGFSNARQNAFFYLGLPVGAILFGLFLIAQVMEKESALYDEQNRAAKLEREPDVSRPQPAAIQRGVAHDPALTMAHSY
jgi:hypothetical protein